ncbi:MAG: hypothetical protein EBU23_18010, partial [Mycobacteriaceae bacterium]|nr:hypothetical protein [Mycobacteriaceae bacterium]
MFTSFTSFKSFTYVVVLPVGVAFIVAAAECTADLVVVVALFILFRSRRCLVPPFIGPGCCCCCCALLLLFGEKLSPFLFAHLFGGDFHFVVVVFLMQFA